MLTESEREWLKTRDKKRPYCFYCEALFGTDSCYWKCVTETCAMYPDMKDAAIFEARVAEKLALYNANTMDWMSNVFSPACWETCRGSRFCEGNLSCAEATLAAARLQVEEEMDAEMDK